MSHQIDKMLAALGLDLGVIYKDAGFSDFTLAKSEKVFEATFEYVKDRIKKNLSTAEAQLISSAVLHLISQVELVKRMIEDSEKRKAGAAGSGS